MKSKSSSSPLIKTLSNAITAETFQRNYISGNFSPSLERNRPRKIKISSIVLKPVTKNRRADSSAVLSVMKESLSTHNLAQSYNEYKNNLRFNESYERLGVSRNMIMNMQSKKPTNNSSERENGTNKRYKRDEVRSVSKINWNIQAQIWKEVEMMKTTKAVNNFEENSFRLEGHAKAELKTIFDEKEKQKYLNNVIYEQSKKFEKQTKTMKNEQFFSSLYLSNLTLLDSVKSPGVLPLVLQDKRTLSQVYLSNISRFRKYLAKES